MPIFSPLPQAFVADRTKNKCHPKNYCHSERSTAESCPSERSTAENCPSERSEESPHFVRVATPRLIGKNRLSQVLCLLACLLSLATPLASAQTLARPGWVGSGMNADPWWKRAVFYRIAASQTDGSQATTSSQSPDYQQIAARLAALRSLSVDALLLPAPALPAPGSNDVMPDLDDLDTLIRRASERDMRILFTLPAPRDAANLTAIARFWLSRGIAGFYLQTPPEASPQDAQLMVQSLRKATDAAVGQRIVVSEFHPDASDTPAAPASHRTAHHAQPRSIRRAGNTAAAQLQIDPRLSSLDLPEAASLRLLLTQSLAQPNVLLDYQPPAPPPSNAPDPYPALARIMATILLTTHSAALIDSSANLVLEPTLEQPQAPVQPAKPAAPQPPPQPPPGTFLPYVPYVPPPPAKPVVVAKPVPPDPLTLWYRQLTALHLDNAVLRFGSKTFLDFDAQNALVWVSRPASNADRTPPVVTVCNLTSSPLQLSLASDLKALGLHGTYMLTLLRSDTAMGAQDLNSVTLPPFAVYIGELHR